MQKVLASQERSKVLSIWWQSISSKTFVTLILKEKITLEFRNQPYMEAADIIFMNDCRCETDLNKILLQWLSQGASFISAIRSGKEVIFEVKKA